MLKEIHCEKFHQKTIKFNNGLNVVLGTETGNNSIGKSTFLLIIDFVFGGKTYTKSTDISNNIGNHDIFFTFEFNNKLFKFCRNNLDSDIVWQCDEKYNKLTDMPLNNFNNWLAEKYEMQLLDLTFREAISRYIRVYGKKNCNENKPLEAFESEKAESAMYALLKIFDKYSLIKDATNNAKLADATQKAYLKAQKYNLIDNIKKTDFNKNNKRIKQAQIELNLLIANLDNSLIGTDLALSEEALSIKNTLTKLRRSKGFLKTKYNIIEDNGNYNFSSTSNSFDELSKFFPNSNIAKIESIENFHNKIALIFKEELQEEKEILKKDLQEYDNLIMNYEKKLNEILQNNNISKNILFKHSNLLKEIEELEKQNNAYEKSIVLKDEKKRTKELLDDLKTKQFSSLQQILNNKMKYFNDFIYSGSCNAPELCFKTNSYVFYTPDDTGTGIACKGLVLFDLSVLNSTKLPILAHDSVILKQISDEAIEKILELYIQSNKQIFIAFDKQDSYTEKAQKILAENAVLKLAPNGKELFGKSWG
ncbi:MAG: DUF2326 domain-containing protein [Candidatus Gastranaerophilaceae bacterium]